MRPFLIINPRSANGATARHVDTITGVVREAIGECAHAFTERPGHATGLARSALREGCDLIVAVGGDGTVNEVVNGFFEPLEPGQPARPLRPGAALGLLPRGTGGDFRRTLSLDGDLRACAQRLRNAPRPLDLGRVDSVGDDGRPASRLFANVGEVGVGARVVEIANRSSKALGGKLTFMLASLRALAGWRDVPVRLSLDGAPPETLSVTTLALANGRFFGGGMMIAPDADPGDGLFDVTVWQGYGLADFVLKSAAMYDGSHVKLKGTSVRRAASVYVEAGGGEAPGIEVDGERSGVLPATFSILPGALRVVA